MTPENSPQLRLGHDTDAEELIDLIRGVYAEYPNCTLDVPGEEPELLEVATAFARRNGEFWVATRGEKIVGCLAYRDGGTGTWELKKLYVHRDERRHGIARKLMALIETKAEAAGISRLVLWTDTRFVEAHAFYDALGYRRTGRDRLLHDISETTEIEFVKSDF